MASVAELRGRLSLDSKDFENGLKSGEIGMRRFEAQFTGLFRRTGELRPERALEGFVRSLAGGDITGAIESLTSRMTGLGLAAGAGLAIAGTAFAKFNEQLKATRDAIRTVWGDLAGSGTGGLGPDQIRSKIQGMIKDLADLEKASKPGALSTVFGGLFGPAGAIEGIHRAAAAGTQLEGQQRVKEMYDELKRSAQELTAIEQTRVYGDKGWAERMQIELEGKKKLTELTNQQAAAEAEINKSGLPEWAKPGAREASRNALKSEQKSARDFTQAQLDEHDRDVQTQVERRRADKLLRLQPLLEQSKLSMEELLDPKKSAHAVGTELSLAQVQARAAQRELNLAERSRQRGDVQGAFEHFREADRIKAQISPLKDSEKPLSSEMIMASFQETKTLLQQIEANTAAKKDETGVFGNR